MNLRRIQKIALARIITDLIESDFIVDENEMKLFEHLISKDCIGISTTMLIEAKKMDFAKATLILAELQDESRKELLETLKQLTTSDGICVALEAILVFSVEQVFVNNAKIYSVPKKGADMANMTVVYIENEDNTFASEQIQNNLETIKEQLRQSGFDFVYIPSIANDFKSLNREYLQKVIRYMIPSVKDECIVNICNNLCGLTTSCFCRGLLYRKLGLNLIDSKPSLLIKINESDVIEQFGYDGTEKIRFSNYLKLEINDADVMGDISCFLDSYSKLVNSVVDAVELKQSRKGKFLYCGFHRSLFNLIAYGRKQKEYRLVFDVSKRVASVFLEPLDGTNELLFLRLNPREIALYLLIARKSLSGKGLDWREHIPTSEKIKLLDEYNHIYNYIGKCKTAKEFKDRIQTNHIRNTVSVLQGVANVEMFIPEHVRYDSGSFYRIKASKKYIKIIEF